MRIIDWLLRRPGTRKTYSYATVIKFVYMMHDKEWWCVTPGQKTDEGKTPDSLVALAMQELRNCRPRTKESSPYGHVWPGGSNVRYTVEFVFVGKVHSDGFIGWEVSYTHPNENGHVFNGPRLPYAPFDKGAIEAFLRDQLEEMEMGILTKRLTQE